MSILIDPAGEEVRALKRAVHWPRKHVLEIGCGDGRLTLRLASLRPGRIEALDPDPQSVRRARRHLPGELSGRVEYHVGHAEKLKYPAGMFDVVVFSWVL